MKKTKLIFVEGLPGLGKSTTASWLYSRLQSEAHTVKLYLEHQPEHPLNVGGDLHPAGDIPGKAFFQIYTPASFIQESLEKWSVFIHAVAPTDGISILDSYPFQNAVRVLLQLDAPMESIREYSEQVEDMVKPLQPVLIYFNHPDSASVIHQFNQISAQRGKEWTNYVIELVTRCPYAEARNLEGFGGVKEFIIAYKQVVDALLSQSCLPRIVLENCAVGWDECYRKIETFLGLP